MSLRISSPLVMLALLAACGDTSPPPPGERITCAIGEGAALASDCTLEQVAGSADFVIHHPDGGFRRFILDAATGMVAPQDGAELLVPQAGEGDAVAFAVGADRYAIPAELITPAAE